MAVNDGILETVLGGTITVTYHNANDGTGHSAVVTDTATTYEVGPLHLQHDRPETAGVPFSVTITAYDTSNNTIPTYSDTVALTATGSGGALLINPTSVTFASGVWTGNLTVNAVNPTVTVRIDNGQGAVGLSDVFATQAGPLAGFQWSTIPSPQYRNVAFPVQLTAEDANGYAVTTYNGTATLGGFTGTATTATNFNNPSPTYSGSNGEWTDGYSFTPSQNILVTDALHYFGDNVSIWTNSGTLLESQAFTASSGAWVETPLSTPLELLAGTTYRITCNTADGTFYYREDMSSATPLGTIGTSYEISGDGFPTNADGAKWWFVDIVAQVTSATACPSPPPRPPSSTARGRAT